MLLLDNSKQKNDKLYNSALKLFDFHGIKGINLGHSKTGIDAAFGPILSAKVINDAFAFAIFTHGNSVLKKVSITFTFSSK